MTGNRLLGAALRLFRTVGDLLVRFREALKSMRWCTRQLILARWLYGALKSYRKYAPFAKCDLELNIERAPDDIIHRKYVSRRIKCIIYLNMLDVIEKNTILLKLIVGSPS